MDKHKTILSPKSTTTLRIINFLMLLFVPVAVFTILFPANEYRDMGIGGAVDCDGPLGVMIFVLPSLAVFLFGTIFYTMHLRRSGRRYLWIFLMMCSVLLTALIWKTILAYNEANSPDYIEVCGKGL